MHRHCINVHKKMAVSSFSDTETSLLHLQDIVDDCVDYKGRPVHRAKSGGWKSAYFMIGVEMAERFAFYGIGSNLITYLTGPLGQSTAAAAKNVNTWTGTAMLLPLLGAFVADSFLGRYWTILFASLIYVLGLCLLSLSAMLPLSSNSDSHSTNKFQVILFFFSIYMVALAQGGHKPCVQAFGADQFDGKHPEECKMKSPFFNWWYFGICVSSIFTYIIVCYVQENFNWGLGFGIPCVSMAIALVLFLLGTKSYRYTVNRDEMNPFMRIGNVFVAAIRNWRSTNAPSAIALEEEAGGTLSDQIPEQFRFLNKALLAPDGSGAYAKACSISEVEEAKALLRLIPIWTAILVYGIMCAQQPTFFTKQGATMDRSITPGFNIPAASLQSFTALAIVLTVSIYDRVFVPIARGFTGKSSGITMLQRIGTGLFLSVIGMVIAALVEMKRLTTAKKYGLVDKPGVTIPLSVWWLIPQYALFGVTETFTVVGLQEFFYDQVPIELRSVGLSLYLSIFGAGSFLSSFLISSIERANDGNGNDSWFTNNLNKGRLDYFYLLLGGLGALGLVMYLHFAKSYIYKRTSTI